MAKKFPNTKYPCMRYFIGDVRDVERLKMAMNGVDYVVHAAALKHVDSSEYNPIECVITHSIGLYSEESTCFKAAACTT